MDAVITFRGATGLYLRWHQQQFFYYSCKDRKPCTGKNSCRCFSINANDFFLYSCKISPDGFGNKSKRGPIIIYCFARDHHVFVWWKKTICLAINDPESFEWRSWILVCLPIQKVTFLRWVYQSIRFKACISNVVQGLYFSASFRYRNKKPLHISSSHRFRFISAMR